jgi:hypothetical protein
VAPASPDPEPLLLLLPQATHPKASATAAIQTKSAPRTTFMAR